MISVTMLLVIWTSRNSASMPWATVISRSPAAHAGAVTSRAKSTASGRSMADMTASFSRGLRGSALMRCARARRSVARERADPKSAAKELSTLLSCAAMTGARRLTIYEPFRSIFYAPQFVALHGRHFAAEGLDVDVVTAGRGATTTGALMDGHAEIALGGIMRSLD